MAARELGEAGYLVNILEARTRPGGRIDTRFVEGTHPIEAGAEFIHGELPLTDKLLKESGCRKKATKGKMYQLRHGVVYEDELLNDQWEQFVQALKALDEDITIWEFLTQKFPGDEYHVLRTAIKHYVEGYDAADVTLISARAIQREWATSDEATQYHIEGGYIRLINFLVEQVTHLKGTIHYATEVKAIEHQKGKIKVITTSEKVFEAEKVIITVPLGVLQRDLISFTPPLPNYAEASCNIGFGGVIKIIIEFSEAFWENDTLKNVGFLFTDATIPTWWTQLPEKTPVLTGWLGGPRVHLISLQEEDLKLTAIRSLAHIFNCPADDIKQKVRRIVIGNWVSDPHTWGAYAYTTLHTEQALKTLQTPVDDTLFFAGEALYSGPEMGTVEAALASGKEIAEKIIG
jgi:monoamine oxidase